MVIKLPKKPILANILKLFNKQGDIKINNEEYKSFDPYVTIKAKDKSFYKTLFSKEIIKPIIKRKFPC